MDNWSEGKKECYYDFIEQMKKDGYIVKKKSTRFKKPLPQEVAEHMVSKGATLGQAGAESVKFVNHYESNGWKVGKNKMVNWKSAATGWITRMKDYENSKQRNDAASFEDSNDTSWINGLSE